jgi:hypothetical protein
MGLELVCDHINIRVGSYGNVKLVKSFLIDAIKKYITNSNIFFHDKDELLEKINQSYEDYTIYENLNLYEYQLKGFECFINHSDCDGYISSSDACYFVKLCNKLNDYFDKNDLYFIDNKFYLYDIFYYSSQTGEDIFFC